MKGRIRDHRLFTTLGRRRAILALTLASNRARPAARLRAEEASLMGDHDRDEGIAVIPPPTLRSDVEIARSDRASSPKRTCEISRRNPVRTSNGRIAAEEGAR